MKFLKLFILIISILTTNQILSQKSIVSSKELQNELLDVAKQWVENWNGNINIDSMMAQYHPDMLYYWRGKPDTYESFKDVMVKFVIPTSDGNIVMGNPTFTLIDDTNAIVGFNFGGDESNLDGAVTLSVHKNDGVWNIYNVHESKVRPLPPNDFEEQFNTLSKEYQNAYMNANCDVLLPYLDENLTIYENGEYWPYEKVKEFCPHLPVKPVLSTDRAYRILNDYMVYEFVSQIYEREEDQTFNETQSRIWKYENNVWKIIQMEVSRYPIKSD